MSNLSPEHAPAPVQVPEYFSTLFNSGNGTIDSPLISKASLKPEEYVSKIIVDAFVTHRDIFFLVNDTKLKFSHSDELFSLVSATDPAQGEQLAQRLNEYHKNRPIELTAGQKLKQKIAKIFGR